MLHCQRSAYLRQPEFSSLQSWPSFPVLWDIQQWCWSGSTVNTLPPSRRVSIYDQGTGRMLCKSFVREDVYTWWRRSSCCGVRIITETKSFAYWEWRIVVQDVINDLVDLVLHNAIADWLKYTQALADVVDLVYDLIHSVTIVNECLYCLNNGQAKVTLWLACFDSREDGKD